jgi:hypothetical protein
MQAAAGTPNPSKNEKHMGGIKVNAAGTEIATALVHAWCWWHILLRLKNYNSSFKQS